ncbi:ubiquitin carboxyl-terminal hydrolase 5-like isoform X1 [Branchiostoma floridae x Branchiostoma japonicum]
MSALETLYGYLPCVKVPRGGEKIYKDECIYCYDTPESEGGLFVCLKSYMGLCHLHVQKFYEKFPENPIYLHLKRTKLEISGAAGGGEAEDPPAKKPTRLAIGVEGGFDVSEEGRYEIQEEIAIVVMPGYESFPYPSIEDTPVQIQLAIEGILKSSGADKQSAVEAWDGEVRQVSKHADKLEQLNNGVKVPPKGWKCSRCDLVENLWMNLTDGSISCGRRYFDGSGGNNHAVDHFRETGFPLAVKLGTITPTGADVYSYDEDDMVEDPHLARHLAHFGINMMSMEKTDKTMTELEIDINQRVGEWATIQESDKQLKPMYGPGYTGMKNMGNSCYLNSVMQVIFTLPDFRKRYFEDYDLILNRAPEEAPSDFTTQMAKVGYGLLSGTFSNPPEEEMAAAAAAPPAKKVQNGITPRMFKTLIGKGHPEFSTNRQQDAQEFFLHLINIIDRHSRGTFNPTVSLKYMAEERIQCVQSGKVRYKQRSDYLLSLPVPVELADNREELVVYETRKREKESKGEKMDPKELVRAKLSLRTCLDSWAEPESIQDFYSSALQARSVANKSTRFATFPNYLMVHLKKFTIGEDWVPKKLDVSMTIPDELDLEHLRGKGIQQGEEELPEGEEPPMGEPAGAGAGATAATATGQKAEPEIDEETVIQLSEMGFPTEACRKAVYYTSNCGAEAAMDWIMQHMDDPDFAQPLQIQRAPAGQRPEPEGAAAGGPRAPESSSGLSEEALTILEAMGFTRGQAIRGLKATDNNLERAADWLFSHSDELDTMPMDTAEQESLPVQATPQVQDGTGKYKLVAFISHMGTSTMCGHYVCHILKDGRWVIYNDEKVAVSENPPKDLAYLYLYQRIQ